MEQISRYRILKKLGAGGMGEVYLAEDLKLGRKVAIKILSEEYTTNRDRLGRFEQEACSASALNHPNILTIYEVGNDAGRHFIATEYIDGVTLRQKLSEARLEPREILDIAVQVAAALEEAHGAGIVHRDIKPDNIMVRRNGYVKVLDFGLAKLTENSTDRTPSDAEAATRVLVHTDAGVVMGTSHYMSPEQARGKPVDARADIWSLGVVMYQMVTERLPFEGETATDVLVAITQKEPAPIARFAPNVPAELDWIIMKALRKAKDERYQTIKELITDLRRLRQKLEFETELERSVAPESFTKSNITVSAAPTVSDKVAPTLTKSATTLSSAEYIVSGIRRHKVAAALVGSLLIIGVIAAVFHFNKAQPLTDKDTVLIADFVNTTGEAVFDGTLKQALSVQLSQSPFLNIFPEERVRETLRYMNRPADDRVTRDVGIEICRRQGIKALLIGSISTLGSHYVLTVEALNAQNGESIAREQTEVDAKEKVLSSLGAAASGLREKLGESLNSIQKYDVPVEQATTSSLEALKAFTMGNEERAKGRTRESLTLYERAVSLDPNFAMAYARISVFYGNTGEFEKAKEYVAKAYELKDRVSERERLYISEKYYGYITGEIPKVIEVLETSARLYPNDYIPHNNLALQYLLLGRYEDARKEAQAALRLSPTNNSARVNLTGAFLGLGRFEEAQEVSNQIKAANPDAVNVHLDSVVLAFLRNDWTTINGELDWARGKPPEADLLSSVAQANFALGQVHKAEEMSRRATALFVRDKRSENAGTALLTMATNQAFIGRCQEAKQNVPAALEQSRGRAILGNAALTFAICGDTAQSQSLLDEMTKNYPLDTPLSSMAAPLVRAAMEKSRGNYEQALQLLETVRTYDMSFLTGSTNNYVRGCVYLNLKKGAEARGEFQTIIDKRGVDVFSPARPLAYLGLARAAAMSGDVAASRKAYQDFFALWKSADADLALLAAAQKEYETLKS
jgi:serine/threonine protein kinase/tetratricopeptide (TPR) repeat protein